MDLLAITLNWLSANLVSAIGVAVFLAVVSLTIALSSFVTRETTLRRRAFQPYMVGNADVLKDRRALDHRDTLNASRMLTRAAARFTPGDSEDRRLRHQMRVAGFLSPQAIGVFYLCRFALGLGLPVVVIVVYPFFSPEATFVTTAIMAVVAALLGFYLPNAYLDRRGQAHSGEASPGLPRDARPARGVHRSRHRD
jgi:hypothetical protein